ncbi:MAG: HypC/HybG/HupF family hydrogenase formation chaperone [Acidimicrobiales bacterium]
MAAVGTPAATAMAASGTAEDLAATALALARRFAAGATMWCVAPQWPPHGRHVAVEFVHPVIVGKRALPAIAVEGADAVAAVRLLARPGDVLLVVSAADDPVGADLLRRSEAWGLIRVWLGAGLRPGGPSGPAGGRADHVVWLDGDDPAMASRSGDVVLLYHLLWELTQVVLEHPGLLKHGFASGPESGPECDDEVCITCSDQGRVAEVQAVHQDGRVEVLVHGAPETVDASLVQIVAPGDLLLVHAGVALTVLTDTPDVST